MRDEYIKIEWELKTIKLNKKIKHQNCMRAQNKIRYEKTATKLNENINRW